MFNRSNTTVDLKGCLHLWVDQLCAFRAVVSHRARLCYSICPVIYVQCCFIFVSHYKCKNVVGCIGTHTISLKKKKKKTVSCACPIMILADVLLVCFNSVLTFFMEIIGSMSFGFKTSIRGRVSVSSSINDYLADLGNPDLHL